MEIPVIVLPTVRFVGILTQNLPTFKDMQHYDFTTIKIARESKYSMDNGWSDKGKKSPNLESVGFLGHVCRLPRQNPFMLKKILR